MKKISFLFAFMFLASSVIGQNETQTENDVEIISTDSSKVQINADKIIIQTNGTNSTAVEQTGTTTTTQVQTREVEEEFDPRFPEYQVPSFEVMNLDANYSQGIGTGLKVFIPNITEKNAASRWSNTIDDYKVRKKLSKESKVHKLSNGEIKAIDMLIPSISSSLIDVYTTFSQVNDGVEVISVFDLGDGTFLTKGDDPAKYAIAEGMLSDYAKKGVQWTLDEDVKSEEKQLKKINSEQKKLVANRGNLEKRIEKNLKTIERLKREIEEAEQDIIINEKEQKDKILEKQAQEQVVNYVKGKRSKVQ